MPDSVKPVDVVEAAATSGAIKAKLPALHLSTRGMYSGFILGCAMTMAATVSTQVGLPVAGAIVFPGGFILVVLLGLELVTGNLAIIPISVLAGRASVSEMLRNWLLVWVFNFLGALLYAILFYGVASQFGTLPSGGPIGEFILKVGRSKTVPYVSAGAKGLATCLLKAALCNWLVCVATVCGMTSTSTLGKVAACWLPVFMFFVQGFEHVVLNMFVIPASILFGSDVTISEMWLWNIIPVTIGNAIGAIMFVALPLWATWGHAYRNWHYEVVGEDVYASKEPWTPASPIVGRTFSRDETPKVPV